MVEELERRIEQAVRTGADLDEIEAEIINPAPMDQEQQAALWLYAWSYRPRAGRDAGREPGMVGR